MKNQIKELEKEKYILEEKESEGKYRQLVECIHKGIYCISFEGVAIFADERMGKILGYTI